MRYVTLGRSGLKVSRICLGMMNYGTPGWRPWILGPEETRPILRRALDLGVNFYDTADMYSDGQSEVLTGRLLLETERRGNLVIATKVFMPTGPGPNQRGLSRGHVLAAVDASLKRLGTDYIDLYQIHRYDPDTPIEETLDVLDQLVRSGRVRYLGASSMRAWQFARMLFRAEQRGWHRFISMQNHYNLIYREEEREMLPLCQAEGIGVLPYSPLARGFLAGNRSREGQGVTVRAKTDAKAAELYTGENDQHVLDQVSAIARQRGLTSAQVALAWLLQRPAIVAPVVGSTQVRHLEEAAAAIDVRLSPEEQQRLDQAYTPRADLPFPHAADHTGSSNAMPDLPSSPE